MYDNYGYAESTSYGPDFLGIYFWFVALAFYFYFAFMLYKMAVKSGHGDIAWWAYIPVANTFLLIKMAGKPNWWFLLLLIPVVNMICFFILWIKTAQNCGASGFWGVMMMFPLINFIAAFIIAFSTQPYSYPDSSPAPPSNQPKQPTSVGR